jgi:hypothetical protein
LRRHSRPIWKSVAARLDPEEGQGRTTNLEALWDTVATWVMAGKEEEMLKGRNRRAKGRTSSTHRACKSVFLSYRTGYLGWMKYLLL